MTARAFPIADETAAEHVRNALQILSVPDFDDLDEIDLGAVRERLTSALEKLKDAEIPTALARSLLAAKEAERLELVAELRGARELVEHCAAGFVEDLPHLYVDFTKGTYKLVRTFGKTFADHRVAMRLLHELRARREGN